MAEVVVLLDNVRSEQNVGAIFRTCDGAGVAHLYLLGYTPTPIDRFGRTVPKIAKTSLGASDMVAWSAIPETERAALIARLKEAGYTIVAVEQTKTALPLKSFVVPKKVAYIFGNEIDGVSTELIQLSDVEVTIPMQGSKESLNVAVCVGIVLFH